MMLHEWTRIDDIKKKSRRKNVPDQLWKTYSRDHYKMMWFSVVGVSFHAEIGNGGFGEFKKADVIKDFWLNYDETHWGNAFNDNPIGTILPHSLLDDREVKGRSDFIRSFVRITHDKDNKFSDNALRVDVSFNMLKPSSYRDDGLGWIGVGFVPDPVSKYLLSVGGNESIAIDLVNVVKSGKKNMKLTVITGRKLENLDVEFIPKKKLFGEELRQYVGRREES